MINRRLHLDERTEWRDENAAMPRSEPTWFLDAADLAQRDELMLRYRRFRNLPDPAVRPPQPGTQDRPSYQAFVSAQPVPPARFLETSDPAVDFGETSVAMPRSSGRELTLQQTFIAAAMMAAFAGGAVGFLGAQLGTAGKALIASVGTEPRALRVMAPVRAAGTSIVSKKPVATATLQVADVAGETNSLIPLTLRAEPALAGQDIVLRLSGLPESAFLTSGHKDDDRVWTLSLDDVKDVKLLVPDAGQDSFEVDVAAFERQSGELAAPVKIMTVALEDVIIQPASAPAQDVKPSPGREEAGARAAAIPAPASADPGVTPRDHARDQARRGDRLLAEGNVDQAREAYEAAWKAGSAEGAFGLARSYDPVVLAALGVASVRPDAARAVEWYARAAGGGKTSATTSIVRLRMKPD